MQNRDRVVLALEHKETDRVPMELWAVEEVWTKLKKHYHTDSKEQILQILDIDIRDYSYSYKGPALKVFGDGSFLTPFGVHMKKVKNNFGVYTEHAGYPLANARTVEEIEAFRMPQVDWFDLDTLSDRIGDKHEQYYIRMQGGCVFELAWQLRGMEQLMIDFVEEPELAHALLKKICDFDCAYIEKMLTVAGDKIDMVYGYDDIGGQKGLLMSPAMIEEFVLPYHTRINKVIKKFGKKHMFHSCGAIFSMIGKIFDVGIDVLNPLQPNAVGMDLSQIKESYGTQGSFLGGVDIQDLLPHGTPEEVYRRSREIIRIMSQNGGYILSSAHRMQADTPVENILAMYQAGLDSDRKSEIQNRKCIQ